MKVVEARIHARPEHLIEQVAHILEYMGVNTIRKRHTVNREMHPGGAEITGDQTRDSAGDAAMRRRILRVLGRGTQRQPRRFRVGNGAPPRDGGDRPPQPLLVFRVEATNYTTRGSGPELRPEPRRVLHAD